MALSCGPTVAEYQALVESLRDIVQKDAQLVDDRARLLDALTKLTERNEMLVEEQMRMREKHEGDRKLQSDIMVALEKQNDLLRQRVEDQEDEISGLENEIAELKDQLSAVPDITVKGTRTSGDPRAKMTEQEKKKIDQDLVDAAENGKVEDLIALLVNGAHVDAARTGGSNQSWTALMLAAQEGHLQIVEVLLASGANVNHENKKGAVALMFAARRGHLDIIKGLLAHGANINHASTEGWTALMEAAYRSRSNVVEVLINRGADLDKITISGRSALAVADSGGHREIAKMLRRAGASE